MVYKIRIILLDIKENIFRDIEIKDKQTLWNLHNGIKSAFSLPGEELSSFYRSDDGGAKGEAIPLEDMSEDGDGEIMSDVYISEAFANKDSKMLFEYGFIETWEFFCELVEVIDEKPAVKYPITVYRYGNVPMKAPSKAASSSKSADAAPFADFTEEDFNENFNDDFENFDDDDFDDGYDDEADEYEDPYKDEEY